MRAVLRISAAAMWLAAVLPSPAAADTIDPEIEALLGEVERLPKEVFEQDPQRWNEVLELLAQHIASRRAAHRTLAPGGAGASGDSVVAVFHQLAASVRELQVTDLASRMLSLGWSGSAPPRADVAPTPIAELAQWAALGRDRAPGAAEVWTMLPLFGPESIKLLLRRGELANAGQANADSLNQDMRNTLEQLKRRANEESRELLALRRAGSGMAQRLNALESVIRAGAAPGSNDASADAARLLQLRAELAALQEQQGVELRRLGAGDVVVDSAPSRVTRAEVQPRASRAALIADIQQRMQAAVESDTDPLQQAVTLGRAEVSLAALDALAREEQVKSAALRQGERAEGQLLQVGAEMKRLTGAIERAASR